MRFRFSKFFAQDSKVGLHEKRTMRRRRRVGFERLEARAMLTTLTVTTLGDPPAANPGELSLREAIAQANSDPAGDIINFAAGLTGAITLGQGSLPITNSMSIDGPGAGVIAIDADHRSRVVSNNQTLTLANDVITDSVCNFQGGGIFNDGTMTMTGDTISDNVGEQGGGIYNGLNLTMSGNLLFCVDQLG